MHVPGADPARDEIVERLSTQAEVCLHADPDRIGVMPTWLGALSCAIDKDQDLPWTLVIQDDADPFEGWYEHLRYACHFSPEPVLCLTYMGGWGHRPYAKNVPYGVGEYLVWGTAVAYHRSIVEGLWEWCTKVWEETGYPHDDCLVACYALNQGFKTALTTRAIFDRAPIRSLIGHHLHEGKPSNRPSHNIVDHPGPYYGVNPRSMLLDRPMDDKMRELAKL